MTTRLRGPVRRRDRAHAPIGLLALGLVLGLTPGRAAYASSCSIIVPAFNFPPYNPLSPAPDVGFSTLVVSCLLPLGSLADSVNYSISLSTGSSGTYATRSFTGQPLEYNLYTTANHTQVLGDGTAGTATITGQLTLPGNATATHPIFGLIPPRQPVSQGVVSDYLTVTIDY